ADAVAVRVDHGIEAPVGAVRDILEVRRLVLEPPALAARIDPLIARLALQAAFGDGDARRPQRGGTAAADGASFDEEGDGSFGVRARQETVSGESSKELLDAGGESLLAFAERHRRRRAGGDPGPFGEDLMKPRLRALCLRLGHHGDAAAASGIEDLLRGQVEEPAPAQVFVDA